MTTAKQRLTEIRERLSTLAYSAGIGGAHSASDVAWLVLRLEEACDDLGDACRAERARQTERNHHRGVLRKVWLGMDKSKDMALEGMLRKEEPWLAKEMDK